MCTWACPPFPPSAPRPFLPQAGKRPKKTLLLASVASVVSNGAVKGAKEGAFLVTTTDAAQLCAAATALEMNMWIADIRRLAFGGVVVGTLTSEAFGRMASLPSPTALGGPLKSGNLQ